MRRTLLVLAAGPLLLGLAACGLEEAPPEPTTEAPPSETPSTETSQSVPVSDGGGDHEVVQPTETTEYVEQGEGSEDR